MAPKDFEKKKEKVGKRKLAPSSETRIDVKIARLEVTKHEDDGAMDDGEGARPRVPLRDLLVQTRHHNAGMRTSAITAIRRMVHEDGSELMQAAGPDVATALAARLMDDDPPVRGVLLPVLMNIVELVPEESASLFSSLVSPFLSSALTKLHTSIRLDAVAMVLAMARLQPRMATANAGQATAIAECLVNLLEPSLHGAGSTPTLLGTLVGLSISTGAGAGAGGEGADGGLTPGTHARLQELKGYHSISRDRLAALDVRMCVCLTLREWLGLLVRGAHPQGETQDGHSMDALPQGYAPPSASPAAAAHVSSSSVFAAPLAGLLTTSSSVTPPATLPLGLCAYAIFQLVQLWIDSGAEEAHEGDQGKMKRLQVIAECLTICVQAVLDCSGHSKTDVQSTLLLAASPGSGPEADTQLMSMLQGAVQEGKVEDSKLLFACIRVVHTHVLKVLPLRTSKVEGSGAGTLSKEGERLTIVMMRLGVHASPTPACVTAARSHVREMEAAGIGQVATSGKGQGKATGSSNPFAALSFTAAAPTGAGKGGSSVPASSSSHAVPVGHTKPPGGQDVALQGSKDRARGTPAGQTNAASSDKPEYDPVADAYRHAWRAAAASVTRLRKCLTSLAAFHTLCMRLGTDIVHSALAAQGDMRVGNGYRSTNPHEASAAGAAALLCSLLPYLPEAHAPVLACLSRLQEESHPLSTMRRAAVAGIHALWSTYGLQDAPAGGRPVNQSESSTLVTAVTTCMPSWLSPLPKYVWSLGQMDMKGTCMAVELLLQAAQRAHTSSPLGIALTEASRMFVPVLYTVKSSGKGAETAQAPVIGPWVHYAHDLQCSVLAFLETVGAASKHELLLRACTVMARHADVSPSVRRVLLESTTRVLLGSGVAGGAVAMYGAGEGQGAAEQTGHDSTSADSAVLCGIQRTLAWLISVCTGSKVSMEAGTWVFRLASLTVAHTGMVLPGVTDGTGVEPYTSVPALWQSSALDLSSLLDIVYTCAQQVRSVMSTRPVGYNVKVWDALAALPGGQVEGEWQGWAAVKECLLLGLGALELPFPTAHPPAPCAPYTRALRDVTMHRLHAMAADRQVDVRAIAHGQAHIHSDCRVHGLWTPSSCMLCLIHSTLTVPHVLLHGEEEAQAGQAVKALVMDVLDDTAQGITTGLTSGEAGIPSITHHLRRAAYFVCVLPPSATAQGWAQAGTQRLAQAAAQVGEFGKFNSHAGAECQALGLRVRDGLRIRVQA